MAAISFCGCSVLGFNSQLGWGQNKSSLDVNVVQDPRNGDFFNPPPIGRPCYFYFGPSFHFWGILQNWGADESTKGRLLYNIRVEDPREILEGTQVILNHYNRSILGIRNIINVFGYWENAGGFGASNVNDSGMPWTQVLAAIQTLTKSPVVGAYGGALNLQGVNYAVDLSLLPKPPAYYRIGSGGGASRSLFSIIQEICEDGGCDFFVELDPGTILPIIRIYTVSRYKQPPLGTISKVVKSGWGINLTSDNNGLEFRNATTTKFLIGGSKQEIFETTPLQPFWGYDIANLPVVNRIDNVPGLGLTNAAFVNISEIAGVLNDGSTQYYVTEFELRAALEDNGPDTWMNYVMYESRCGLNNKAALIGPDGIKNVWAPQAAAGLQAAQAAQAIPAPIPLPAMMLPVFASDAQQFAQNQLYRFVRRIAQEWYGKKYWVQLPFVFRYTDPTTLVVHNSHDISDGGWKPNSSPLNLYPPNYIKFILDDTRWEGMAVFNPTGIDLEQLNAEDTALQNNGLFTKIQVDKSIYTWPQTGIPAVVITVPSVQAKLANIGGDLQALGVLFGQPGIPMAPANIQRALQRMRAFGAADIRVAPQRYYPVAVALPLISNIDTYGPWFLAGAPGQVDVEQDQTLVPWVYGSDSIMDLAAKAKVTSAVTFMQVAENGKLEQVGMPITSLGTQLLAGGPDITNIQVAYGPGQGIKTSYQFRTFTSLHLNRFVKGTDDRLKRMGKVQTELGKTALLALNQFVLGGINIGEARGGRQNRFPRWQFAWGTPHPVIISNVIADPSGNIRLSTALTDPQEGWGGIGAVEKDKDLFNNSALCGLSAVFRPFINNINRGQSILLPKLVTPTGGIMNSNLLNPYKNGHDIEYLVSGDDPEKSTFLAQGGGFDWSKARPISLSMPMYACGWGYDIHCKLSPTGIPQSPDLNVGPVDMLWDKNRGCWTSHDLIWGTLITTASGSNQATMSIANGGGDTLTVYNIFGSDVSGTVIAGYFPYQNQWIILAADCPV
jgi:hypothetical protein